MGRSTKPLRVDKDDAELIQSLAEEQDARPAEIVSELVASVDVDQDLENEPIGKCPTCGYQFTEPEVHDGLLTPTPWAKCPDPENEHAPNEGRSIEVQDMDNV